MAVSCIATVTAPARVDLRGKLVRDLASGQWPAGLHTVTWDSLDARGAPAGSGAYVLRLKTEDGRVVGAAKVMLARRATGQSMPYRIDLTASPEMTATRMLARVPIR